MKKTSIFLLIVAFALGVSGCNKQQNPLTQKENQGESNTTTETVTNVKSSLPDGNYKGNSIPSGCEFTFEVEVIGEAVNGTGVGTGEDIICNINLSGTTDEDGDINGQASGNYTATVQGLQIDWYLSGKFKIIEDKDKENDGYLIVDLYGTGNTCPDKIPCVNNDDIIVTTLKKLED